jgi:hypothetical protein
LTCIYLTILQVLLSWTDDPLDPQYEISRECLVALEAVTDAKGRALKVHKLPLPTPMYITEEEAQGLQVCTWGTFREHSGNIQGTSKERSGKIQGTFRERSGNIQGTFRENSGNIQGTFREHPREHPRNVQGKFREHSGNIQRKRYLKIDKNQGRFREHAWNIQRIFREHPGNIQGTSGEESGNIQGTFSTETLSAHRRGSAILESPNRRKCMGKRSGFAHLCLDTPLNVP